jgi:hypothetical protein
MANPLPQMLSSLLVIGTKFCTLFFSPQRPAHLILCNLVIIIIHYLVTSTNCETAHYAVFPIPQLFSFSYLVPDILKALF